jgi:hypothetical protein
MMSVLIYEGKSYAMWNLFMIYARKYIVVFTLANLSPRMNLDIGNVIWQEERVLDRMNAFLRHLLLLCKS